MWLRPRTELLPSDPRWWEFDDDPVWLTVSIVFGLIGLAYVAAAVAGVWRSRDSFGIGLFVLFLLLRSLFLGTLENPEPRYTLECYPVVIVMARRSLSINRIETIENPHKQAPKSGTPYVKRCIQTFQDNENVENSA